MGLWIQDFDVPQIDPVKAGQLIADIEAEALRRVPALETAPATLGAQLLGWFRRVVVRWHIEGPAAMVTTSTGPYGVGLAPAGRVGWQLADNELADLRAIVATTAPTTGGPRGVFPAAAIDRVFDGPTS